MTWVPTDTQGIARLGAAPNPDEVDVQVLNEGVPAEGLDVAFYVAPPPQPEVTLSALGVPADGTTDVSSIIPQALLTVAPGTRIICDAARYYIANVLALPRLVGDERYPLVFDGADSVFWRRYEDTRIVRFGKPYVTVLSGYSNAVIRHLRVLGPEPDWRYQGGSTQSDWQTRPAIEFDAGLRVAGGVGLLVEDSTVERVGGDGVQVQGTRPTGAAQQVVIRGFRGTYCRRQGLALTNCQGVEVDEADLTWIGRSIVDLEPYASTWYSNDVTLRGVRGEHFYNYLIAAGGQGRHDGLVIDGCIGTGGLGFLVLGALDAVAQPSGVQITRNRYTWDDPEFVQTRNLSSLRVRAADPVIITDNTFTFRAERIALTEAVGGGVVRGNIWRGVRDGYAFDSLGAGPDAWVAEGNEFYNRRNEPVEATWR